MPKVKKEKSRPNDYNKQGKKNLFGSAEILLNFVFSSPLTSKRLFFYYSIRIYFRYYV